MQRRLQARPLLIAGALAVTGAAITQVPAVLAYAVGMVETKRESFSFVARGASNQRSLEIVLDTLGLGVGLGGNRPSSLPLFVVSCLGIPGTALLIAVVVIAIVRAVRTGQITSVWALLGGLTAGTVAVPDLSTPLIWVALAACIAPAMLRPPHRRRIGGAGAGAPWMSSTGASNRRCRTVRGPATTASPGCSLTRPLTPMTLPSFAPGGGATCRRARS